MKRVLPISSLRFVLASWVVVGHFFPPILVEHQHTPTLIALGALVENSVSGPAAVIVFFVISGFCIHFPNRNGLSVPSWKLYFMRRYVRILIPMAVAMLLSLPLGVHFGLFGDSILWSLLCEEIYYLLYPALLAIRDLFGWRSLMGMAWALSIAVILTNPSERMYIGHGPALTWALGLPCWLLGCHLAERLERLSRTPVSVGEIWMWRGGVWAYSVAASALTFHSPIRWPITLNLFAVLGVFWIEREIRFYRAGRSPRFENLGESSYSIYLTHIHGAAAWYLLPLSHALHPWANWFGVMLTVAVFSTVFYRFVEKPSHRLARKLSTPALSYANKGIAASVASRDQDSASAVSGG